jgi:hypothetical protein
MNSHSPFFAFQSGLVGVILFSTESNDIILSRRDVPAAQHVEQIYIDLSRKQFEIVYCCKLKMIHVKLAFEAMRGTISLINLHEQAFFLSRT